MASGAGQAQTDAPPGGWPSDGLWDWDVEEIDYAQDIELEQYARRVLRGEHDD